MGASLAVGLLIGALIGRSTAPIPAPPGPAPAALPVAPPTTSPADALSLARRVGEMLESDEAEGFSAVGEMLSAVGILDIVDWGRAPEQVTQRIINEMSDAELIGTITSVTKLEPEDLEEFSDLRDYANRLSHIAMSGLITPEISDEFDHDALEVQFSTKASPASGAQNPRFEFDEGTRKIYAVIPNGETADDHVMVHWYRVDQPEILLFDRYRVNSRDDYSYVWLKSPGRWNTGSYRVEFFSADEYLTPIGSGTYSVVEE